MCTALAYKTKDFYFGRTLDYESSYGEEIVITPRQYPFTFRNGAKRNEHYALIGMAHVAGGYPLYEKSEELLGEVRQLSRCRLREVRSD